MMIQTKKESLIFKIVRTDTIESIQLFPFTASVLTTVNMFGYICVLYRPPGFIPTQIFVFQHFWAENNFLMVEVDKSFIIAPEKPVPSNNVGIPCYI